MNYLAVALLLLTSTRVSQALKYGGASSIRDFMTPMIDIIDSKFKCVIEHYYPDGTITGLKWFEPTVYEVVGSDIPLPADLEKKFLSQNRTTATVPVTIATYSVIVKSGNLSLSACQLAKIYLGTITKWEQISGSKKNGVIVPLMRDSGSGTTALFTRYLREACPTLWPQKFVGPGPFQTGNKNIVLVTGSAGMSKYVFGNALAIGYAETNNAINFRKNTEVAIQNAANKYVRAATSNAYLSLPYILPHIPFSSWANVSLVYRPGENTYPLVSFIYLFAKGSYKTTKHSFCVCNVQFLNYAMNKVGRQLADSDYYNGLPAGVIRRNRETISKIVC